LMSPWGRITVTLAGIVNLTSSAGVSPKSVVNWSVWVAISRLL
jgi:hypothetical protein